MIKLRNTITAALGLALLSSVLLLGTTRSAWAAGAPVVVSVTGTVSNAEVNNPDLQPVQFQTTLVQIGPGIDTVNFPVPAGKRLCIDYVTIFPSASGAPQTINFTTSLNGTSVAFSVIGQYTGSAGISEPVKIYADPSTNVGISLTTGGETGVDIVSFTGHYINH